MNQRIAAVTAGLAVAIGLVVAAQACGGGSSVSKADITAACMNICTCESGGSACQSDCSMGSGSSSSSSLSSSSLSSSSFSTPDNGQLTAEDQACVDCFKAAACADILNGTACVAACN